MHVHLGVYVHMDMYFPPPLDRAVESADNTPGGGPSQMVWVNEYRRQDVLSCHDTRIVGRPISMPSQPNPKESCSSAVTTQHRQLLFLQPRPHEVKVLQVRINGISRTSCTHWRACHGSCCSTALWHWRASSSNCPFKLNPSTQSVPCR